MTSNQEEYFALLEKIAIGPIYTAGSFLQEDKYIPGRRIFLDQSRFPVDYRTILSNEICFDLDAKSYAQNSRYAKLIIEVLESRNIPYYLFISGGKGIHIHCFFEKLIFESNDLKNLFKNALEKGLKFKHIREFLFNLILDEANIDKALRTRGGIFDSNGVFFDDEAGKHRLIRVVGGKKIKFDPILKCIESTAYKSMITKEELTDKKITITNVAEVKYPDTIELFSISEGEFAQFLTVYLNSQKNKENESQYVKLDGLYIELPGVMKLREGVGVGLRAEGAKVLSIALRNDGFAFDKAQKEIESYALKCSQAGDKFSTKEAIHWLKWVYSQPDIFWSNCLLKAFGKDFVNFDDEYNRKLNHNALKILENPKILQVIDSYLANKIVGENKTRQLILLLLLSSKFPVDKKWNISSDPKPQSIILSSSSSSGKSYITKAILSLMGEENKEWYSFTRMTKAVLNYFEGVNMTNKVLFIEELQGLDESSNQLRLWISEGKLKLATVEKVENGDESHNELVMKETLGQPVFITGTAEDNIDEQLNNRSWVISLDTSKEQTKQILQYQHKSLSISPKAEQDVMKMHIQEALAALQPYHFIIPYLDPEFMNIPMNDVRVRRDFKKLSDLICCSALLHQRQRVILQDDAERQYILCDFEDYKIAKQYCESILTTSFSGMTNLQQDILKTISEMAWSHDFTRADVQKVLGWSSKKTWTILSQLEELGFVLSEKKQGDETKYHVNPKKQISQINIPNDVILRKHYIEGFPAFLSQAQNDSFYYMTVIKTPFLKTDRQGVGPKKEDSDTDGLWFTHNLSQQLGMAQGKQESHSSIGFKVSHLFNQMIENQKKSFPEIGVQSMEHEVFINNLLSEGPLPASREVKSSENFSSLPSGKPFEQASPKYILEDMNGDMSAEKSTLISKVPTYFEIREWLNINQHFKLTEFIEKFGVIGESILYNFKSDGDVYEYKPGMYMVKK